MSVTIAGSVSPLVATILRYESLLATHAVYRVVLNGTFRTFWRAVACLAVLDALATLVRMT